MNLQRVSMFLLVAAIAASCVSAAPLEPTRVRPATSASAPNVVVIQSFSSKLFEAPVESFVQQIDATVTLFEDGRAIMHGTSDPARAQRLLASSGLEPHNRQQIQSMIDNNR